MLSAHRPAPVYRPGIDFKAQLKHNPVALELTRWGVDIPLKITVTFARAILIQATGERLIAPGDVIEAPYNIPRQGQVFQRGTADEPGRLKFRVTTVAHTGNFMHRWLYLTCSTELLEGDPAIQVLAR